MAAGCSHPRRTSRAGEIGFANMRIGARNMRERSTTAKQRKDATAWQVSDEVERVSHVHTASIHVGVGCVQMLTTHQMYIYLRECGGLPGCRLNVRIYVLHVW